MTKLRVQKIRFSEHTFATLMRAKSKQEIHASSLVLPLLEREKKINFGIFKGGEKQQIHNFSSSSVVTTKKFCPCSVTVRKELSNLIFVQFI